MTGTLFVVATPIGNLEDISPRALRTLQEVDVILCEDTRKTSKLLSRYSIETSLLSYHQHSREEKMKRVLTLLQEEKNVALVTDSGTPGISDPGNELISFLLFQDTFLRVIPIPGASAVTALASVSGFPMNAFLFLGFAPHKKGRKTFFKKAMESEHSVILYESPHRIIKTLQEMREIDGERQMVVGRELTKQFETIYRGSIDQVFEQVQKGIIKGEFVLAVQGVS
ncbi:MAG: 16S rRNA (cytidine(1402)-2'-O)-methyltransferase [bacterium]|nr:16S rRNA (cytidine(1402)-2'-O)-methyltransferase [bacterium]